MKQQGREVVIVEAVRTPIGRGHLEKGYYKDVHPSELLGRTYVELLSRAGVDAAVVENVISGCVQQFAEQGQNVARNAWLAQGLPIETSATTLDLQCGSAQQAVNFGAAQIASGIHDVVIGCGVEHMGRVSFGVGAEIIKQYGTPFTEDFYSHHPVKNQGIGAELIAAEYEIPRSELDELALQSHQKAHRATEEGWFAREILPFQVNGDTFVKDQGIRPSTTLEALAALKPAFKPDGVVTAGNASQISDGAAAVLLMTREKAAELGLTPRAVIVDQTTVGCDPVKMLEGPIPATKKILERNGMTIGDIDYVEINEAFAPVVAAWAREYKPDMARVNPRGGAMALGHPLGSTGARLLTTLLHELEDDDKEIGLVTMCCGGGLWHRHIDPARLMSAVHSYFEGINDERYDDVGALFAPDGVLMAPGVSPRVGPEQIASYFRKALTHYPKHYDDPVRIIEAGSVVTVEIHFTGELENGAPMEFDAVDVFDLDDEGRIVKMSSWYDSHAVRRDLRAALEHGRAAA